jgi:hypothetical protein
MSGSDDWLDSAEGKSPAQAAQDSISGIILAIAGGIIAVISAFFDGLGRLLDVFGAARDFLVSLITNPITILQATAAETARSLTVGAWSFFGPLTFAVGVASIIAAFWLWDAADVSIPFVDRVLPWRGD